MEKLRQKFRLAAMPFSRCWISFALWSSLRARTQSVSYGCFGTHCLSKLSVFKYTTRSTQHSNTLKSFVVISSSIHYHINWEVTSYNVSTWKTSQFAGDDYYIWWNLHLLSSSHSGTLFPHPYCMHLPCHNYFIPVLFFLQQSLPPTFLFWRTVNPVEPLSVLWPQAQRV